MRHFLFLAWHYARFHRLRTGLLVAAVAVVAALPLVVAAGVAAFEEALSSRAQTSPLVVGAPGGRFDLVLAALYYRQGKVAPLPYGVYQALARTNPDEGGAQVFPLHAARTAGGRPLVGSTLEYFDYRGLVPTAGRRPAVLGEVALGAEAARGLGLKPGDTLLTDQESLFDLAKNLPLRLHVVGVFGATGTPDDRALFCDVKTCWIVEGLGHGHDDVAKADKAQLLKEETGAAGTNLTASAAVRAFVEVTPENIGSFHFHGETADFPLTAALVVPASPKAGTLLATRWNEPARRTQALVSWSVVGELMEVVFKVERFFNLGLAVVTGACLLVLALVFSLSLRLREAERDTLFRLGASRHAVAMLLVVDLVLVIAAGLAIAGILATAAAQVAPWVCGKVL